MIIRGLYNEQHRLSYNAWMQSKAKGSMFKQTDGFNWIKDTTIYGFTGYCKCKHDNCLIDQ